jgi:hypothetical protein
MIPSLFLVVDGIPISVAREVFDAGGMPGFAPPVPVVSCFPSLTNVAVPTLLSGVMDVRPPGYEARYYDPEADAVRGGFGEKGSEPGLAPYRTRPEGTLGHFAVYGLRGALTWSGIRWIGRRFRNEGGPWLGYLAATDGIAHFDGRDSLVAAFSDVCAQVVEARRRYERGHGVEPRVVLCSDHGFSFDEFEVLPHDLVVSRLEIAGFRQGPPRGLGFRTAPMGTVGAGAVWCDPAAASELAEIVAELPGVDVAACRISDGVRVFGVREGMEVANLRCEGPRWRVEPVTGDPLGLVPLLEPYGDAVSDAAEFELTRHHRYPDAAARLHHGLTDLVRYPAQVLFSMERGWNHGPMSSRLAAAAIGGLVGTHGALLAEQSLGFVSTAGAGEDVEALRKPAVRARDVFRPFAAAVRAGAAGV